MVRKKAEKKAFNEEVAPEPAKAKTLDTPREVQQYLMALLQSWRSELQRNRDESSGAKYIELNARMEFLTFLAQEYANLPIKK